MPERLFTEGPFSFFNMSSYTDLSEKRFSYGERVYESRQVRLKRLGGYSDGVPPLPIPNREVKPISADGTAFTRGRVGSRHFKVRLQGLTFFCVYAVPEEEVSARRCD